MEKDGPRIESVTFEILVDESDQDYERSPFADISDFSTIESEKEVLLCPGTTFRVESVEMEEQVIRVRVHMCQREVNKLAQQLTSGFETFMGVDSVLDEVDRLVQAWDSSFFFK